jgi:TolA-binding protein
VNDYLTKNKENKALIKPMLKDMSDFAVSQSQHSKAVSYLMPLVKDYKSECKSDPASVLQLAKSMASLNKRHAASVIYANYKNAYPTAPADENLENIMTDFGASPTSFIDTIFERVFVDPDQFGLNRTAALQFVDVTEAQALSAPCDPKTPDYLYKAGEIARSIRTLPKAMSIYDWLLEEYPDYDKTPTVYFLKGFMLENNANDKEGAREIYQSFLDKYPNHEMADDVTFLLENLDKSDEEILKYLEEKQSQNPVQNQ